MYKIYKGYKFALSLRRSDVKRQFSTGLLHFCTSCDQESLSFWVQTNFSKLDIAKAMESKKCLPSCQRPCWFAVHCNNNISLWGKGWASVPAAIINA